MYKYLVPVLLIIIGETIYNWSELIIAKQAKSLETNPYFIIKIALIATISGLIIIAGYYYGYKLTKNIWIVTAASICTILITEPIISWLIFHEIPTRGATFGLIFGILGISSTIFL